MFSIGVWVNIGIISLLLFIFILTYLFLFFPLITLGRDFKILLVFSKNQIWALLILFMRDRQLRPVGQI